MTIKECYASMNADFDGVMSRLLAESRIEKFAVKFIDDPSFKALCDSYSSGDIETAFRAAHTLKGTSANLGFTDLFEKASAVTEELRNGNPGPDFEQKLKNCTESYNAVCYAIKNFSSDK